MSCLSLQDLSEHDLEELLREEAQHETDPVYMGANQLDAPLAVPAIDPADMPQYAEVVAYLDWALRRIRTSLDTGTMYADALDTLNRARQALRCQP